MALFHLRWLLKFESADAEHFDYLHHNSRLSNLLTGSFESPMQVIVLIVLWVYGKLEVPWHNTTTITDSHGRQIDLGIIPGILSLVLSVLSIIKGFLELSEAKNWLEQLKVCLYGACNLFIRLPSLAMAIIYFGEWSVILLVVILIANFTVIVRYDRIKRKTFSASTSVMVSVVTPFVSSDQTNMYQRTDNDESTTSNDEDKENRRRLSAKVSFVTTLLIFLSNLTLFLLLVYDHSFKYSSEIILSNKNAKTLLSVLLLPGCGITLFVNYIYGQKNVKKQSPHSNYWGLDNIYVYIREECGVNIKSCCQLVGLILAFLGILLVPTISILNGQLNVTVNTTHGMFMGTKKTTQLIEDRTVRSSQISK